MIGIEAEAVEEIHAQESRKESRNESKKEGA
jgi:hypothetical protein